MPPQGVFRAVWTMAAIAAVRIRTGRVQREAACLRHGQLICQCIALVALREGVMGTHVLGQIMQVFLRPVLVKGLPGVPKDVRGPGTGSKVAPEGVGLADWVP